MIKTKCPFCGMWLMLVTADNVVGYGGTWLFEFDPAFMIERLRVARARHKAFPEVWQPDVKECA